MPQTKLVGWRYAAMVCGITGAIALAIYPIAIAPYFDSTKWKNYQKYTRSGVKQEDIQPGGMKVWSDPFDRKKSDSK